MISSASLTLEEQLYTTWRFVFGNLLFPVVAVTVSTLGSGEIWVDRKFERFCKVCNCKDSPFSFVRRNSAWLHDTRKRFVA
jgi:hypothetical protein